MLFFTSQRVAKEEHVGNKLSDKYLSGSLESETFVVIRVATRTHLAGILNLTP